MISTYSSFLYGYTINSSNYSIDFKEGSTAKLATISTGSYTATTICDAIADALNAAGDYTYSVSFDRDTRKFTITADSTFYLLCNTGSHLGTTAFDDLGYSSASDTTAALTHASDNSTGILYSPQLWLQDYISSDDYQQAVDATINKSASGQIEVYRVGIEKFVEFSLKWVCDFTWPSSSPVRNNQSAVAEARAFMQFITTKSPIEFMPDEDDMATFQTLLLEKTASSSSGTGYKLDEQYERGLSNVFETGKLQFRVIE